MKNIRQGFLIRSLYYSVAWLITIILISTMSSILVDVHADTMADNRKYPSHHHIVIVASPDSTIQKKLANIISDKLSQKYKNTEISIKPSNRLPPTYQIIPDIIIAIGLSAIQSSRKNHTNVNRLLITTDPGRYSNHSVTTKHTAILYMTQSYCKQLEFIKQLNPDWHTISYLHDNSRNINRKNLETCAHQLKLGIYGTRVSNIKYLSENIKDALNHSDLLLALPDKKIYNSETVKNILLTCYRYRKPVIAFSQNFVRAGALAAIYSNINQIADSAVKIINDYIRNKNNFTAHVFYPEKFDISINHQVFDALNLDIPDLQKIKQTLTRQQYSLEVMK